jgi:hypothetical protein
VMVPADISARNSQLVVEIPSKLPAVPTPAAAVGAPAHQVNGSMDSHGGPKGPSSRPSVASIDTPSVAPRLPPTGVFRTHPVPTKDPNQLGDRPVAIANGLASNPFSSSPPKLEPPDQSPTKSRAYDTISGHVNGLLDGAGRGASVATKPPALSIAPPLGAVLSWPPNEKRGGSPVKDHAPPATKISPVPLPPQGLSTPYSVALNGPMSVAGNRPPNYDRSSPLLPPSSGGRSPQKHSPPLRPQSANGLASSPVPAILPPIAALSPSPRPQNPTPPVKPTEPTRPSHDASRPVPG